MLYHSTLIFGKIGLFPFFELIVVLKVRVVAQDYSGKKEHQIKEAINISGAEENINGNETVSGEEKTHLYPS